MKTILVPTDFSKHSENAIMAATLIARHQNANLVILHMAGVNEGSLIKNQNQNVEETFFNIRMAEKNFETLLEKPYFDEILVTPVIHKNSSFSEINNVVAEYGISLIVMSSHGTSGLHEMIIGSNSEKVIRFSDVPVLVIKEEAAAYKMGSGVYSSDFSAESVDAYHTAKNFFSEWKTTMKMLYVNPSGRKFKNNRELNQMLTDFFTAAGESNVSECINNVTIYAEHSIEKGIFNFSKDINADFIVIPNHAHKGIAHILKGSLSEDVANHSMIPVLTIKI